MGTQDGEERRFESARLAAGQILDRLREGDSVALFLTGGTAKPELGRLYHTHETVRMLLAQSTLSVERADLAAKLQQARALLAERDEPSRDLHSHR